MTTLHVRRILLAALHTTISAIAWWAYMGLFFIVVPLAVVLIALVVGIPITIGLLAGMRGVAELERRLSNVLLGTSIEPAVPLADLGDGYRHQLVPLVRSASTWRAVLFLVVRMVMGFAAMMGLLIGGGTAACLFLVPFHDGVITIDEWTTTSGPGSLWALPFALVAAAVTTVGAAALGWASARIGEVLLGPAESERVRILERRTADLGARQVLARELHDLVGHTMSTVVVQAGAARRVGEDDPKLTARALEDIENLGRRALEELDGMLATLRDGDQADLEALGETGPTLADLDPLVEAVRTAGVAVQVAAEGDVKLVPREVSATAYRIVQEALTNVIRHAGATSAIVALAVGSDDVSVEVVNGEPAPGHRRLARPGRRGRGIQGMTERAEQLGGQLFAGPEGTGYRLSASLPLRPAKSDPASSVR